MLASRSDFGGGIGEGRKEQREHEEETRRRRPREKIMVPAIIPRLIWMSSPSAAMAAERMSIRVPSTRVSYSTNMPRTKGTFSQRPC